MRFHKFNRNRSLDPMQKYCISQRKASYLADRGKLRVLDSFHTENQTWGALHKAWKGYTDISYELIIRVTQILAFE